MNSTESGKDLSFIDFQEASNAHKEIQLKLESDAISSFSPNTEHTRTELVKAIIKTFEGTIKDGTAKKHLKGWVKNGYFHVIQEGKGPKPGIYKRTSKEVDLLP